MKMPLILAFIASVATALAVEPPPDGGYPNGNTAEGQDALFSLTSGFSNTAVGADALYLNDDGFNNTGIGAGALFNNTFGISNTACGAGTLFYNTTGGNNTASGVNALSNNTNGFNNTADGMFALLDNTTGSNNTGCGFEALESNTTGDANTAVGLQALLGNTTGSNNIALGYRAGWNLGDGSDNIDIGNEGVFTESGIVRIGTMGIQTAVYVAGVRTSPLTKGDGLAIGVDADGRLGVRASSARFKEAIQPMAKSSEVILSLKPVTFRYKKQLDPDAIPQFGLVAEDVAKVDPDLVAKDDQGKPYTVRYEAVNAMLLNEFLKAHQQIQDQASEIAELKSALKEVTGRLDAKGL